MKSVDYFLKALHHGLYRKSQWYYSMFCVHQDGDKSPFHYISGRNHFVTIGDEHHKLDDRDVNEPALDFQAELEIDSSILHNLIEKRKVSIGQILCNKLLLADPFGSKIPFMETPDIEDIEGIVAKAFYAENELDRITVEEYRKYTLACDFLLQFADIFNVGATPKNVVPPPNITEYKEKLYEDYNKKYGKEWRKDTVKVTEFINELKEKDNEWLKGDPSDGFLMSGKNKNDCRPEMYLAKGKPHEFEKEYANSEMILESLTDGWSKDPDKLASMYGEIIAASYSRGVGTAMGGDATKRVDRAMSSCVLTIDDCKTTVGYDVEVTKANASTLIGRYQITTRGIEKITDTSKLIGSTITIRSPLYCKAPDNNFCKTCGGEVISRFPKGIGLICTYVTGRMMYIEMKKMHVKQLALEDVSLGKIIT